MMLHVTAAAENLVLAELPVEVRERLQPLLLPVYCERSHVLVQANEPPRFVYFPVTAVISLVVRLSSGQLLEVGLVGRRDCVGARLAEGTGPVFEAIVQIPGAAWRADAAALEREMARTPALAGQLRAALQRISDDAMRIAACNMFHSIEQRCVRQLLTIADLIGPGDVTLTHEMLATMLGVRRASVTMVLRKLHGRGLIAEHRGRISLSDRSGLEAVCCECRDSAVAANSVRGQRRRW
jgi:CRP-like cAMP-binding protein